MRVLHLIETLGRGGAENLLVTLLPALEAEGVEPLVAVLRQPFDLQPQLEERGIRVVRLKAHTRWNLIAAQRALAKLCQSEAVDIVHAHLYFPSLYAALLGKTGAVPIVETFHNLAYGGANRRNAKLALRRNLRGWAVRGGTARCFAVSQAVADHYAAALGLTSVEILPNPIDLHAIDQVGDRTAGNEARQSLRIVVPGRLVGEKGHRDLFDALAARGESSFELRFVGGGPLEDELRRRASELGVSLEITGSVPHDRFLSEIAEADIVVIPSRHEGFGIAAAEAMALAKPVVAASAGGLPEVIGSNGVLVPVADPEALRQAIDALATDAAQRRELGRRAARDATQRFGPEGVAGRLGAVYRELANTGGNCAPNR